MADENATIVDPADSAPADEKDVRPVRSRRSTKAAKADSSEVGGAVAAATAAVAAALEAAGDTEGTVQLSDEGIPLMPKRRRGRPSKAEAAARKAAEEAIAHAEAVVKGDALGEHDTEAAPKEAPKTSPRRSPRASKAADDAHPVTSEKEAEPGADSAEDAPAKGRSTRSTRSRGTKAADAEATEAEATSDAKAERTSEATEGEGGAEGPTAVDHGEEGEDQGPKGRSRSRRSRSRREDEAQEGTAGAAAKDKGGKGHGPQAKDKDRTPKGQGQDHGENQGRRNRDKGAKGNNNQDRNAKGNRDHQDRNNDRQGRNRHKKDRQPQQPTLTKEELEPLKLQELRAKAQELSIPYTGVHKADLIDAIYVAAAAAEGFKTVKGVLEFANDNYGFLRTANYMQGDDDAFVPMSMIRSQGLRRGDLVEGTVRPKRPNDKFPALAKIASVNGRDPALAKDRPRFRDLTPIYPNERLVMEMGRESITGRAIDLVSPIGKGQRGLIVSPPKAGKTTVLKRICQSIAHNNPEVHLICLLVDERPEEVTDMERSIRGDVVASTFDMPADNHTQVAELVIERAKRLVELGEDVVVVLDSITRLARAYNLAAPASGRILSGGVDSAALYPPKRFLGAARNIEGGGSLTILASALIDTGSKMDEVIFEEFKGTGNMELKLNRELADKRIFPAIDPVASGTRNEELLINATLAPFVWGLRRILANMNNVERAEASLVKGLKQTNDNQEFLIRSAKKAAKTDYID